jgi:phospholipid-binding lipoprotein MlaA
LPFLFSSCLGRGLVERLRFLMVGVALAALAGCAAPMPDAINDPYEADNRRVHAFNVAADKAVIRPIAQAIAPGAQGPVGVAVSKVANNLSMPQSVVNKVLQGKPADAVHNTVRFALNSTLGLAGLFDPASAIGIEARESDFGETLHVWGVPEGHYEELPLIGPSTARDTVGMVVDLVIDPLGLILPPGSRDWARAAKYGSKLGDRARFSSSVDSILHESADSYAQTRLLYLQNRRFELGQEIADDDFIDPYE